MLESILIKCLCSLAPKALEDPKSRALKDPGELILSFGEIIPKCDGRLAQGDLPVISGRSTQGTPATPLGSLRPINAFKQL